ncbi:hypothetical protein B5X24_HaOG204033 [Helicoverpa armigera]|uniref:Exonuclease domain-containing protein n=1 Tax=Helicoverpa armigera TaxID=29058 RepID=A0A2W1BTC5_HELAM|nr:hypothetical protein B5X24_HaOG204033 [Helicoverpa armigera]
MLPSTGYFKGYNCPFYDNGLCERPYCHFRHVKKESQSTSSDGIESGAILQKLVSAAVQKVLQQKETSATTTTSQPESSTAGAVLGVAKATYNPTPIAELNKINNPDIEETTEDVVEQRKRHIPVPYTPRKPAGLPIQRPIETNGSSKPFIYIPPPVKYTPGSTENVQCDKYTPTGSTVSTEKYLPGSETELQEYNPNEGSNNSNKRNYVPSDKNTSKKKILEYKPAKVSTKSEIPTVTYQPTPRSLAPCFSSDEEEPDPKKIKMSSDLNGLDDLGPEFDILDQILHEEKSDQDKVRKNSLSSDTKKTNVKNDIDNNQESKKSVEKRSSEKNQSDKNHNSSKSHHKSSSDKKDKQKSEEKSKKEDKLKDSERKSRHKSSSKDKEKEKKDKHSSDKKHHSSSKSSDSSSSKHSSSKKHDTKKHSSNSKHKSKTKDKSDHKSSRSSKESKSEHKSSKHNDSNNMSDNDDFNAGEELLDEEFDMESDEEAIALECKKIFDEYVPIEKPKIIEDTPKIEDTNEEETIIGKKRISRAPDKAIKVTPKPPVKPDFKVSAAQAMAQRLAKVREFHSAKNSSISSNSENTQTKSNYTPPATGNTKIRIAHVPYASTLLNAKKVIPPSPMARTEPSTSCTITQTVKKGVQRVAHVPNEKFIDRPGVLEPLGSKIAANIRSTYLNMMIDECLKLYLSAHDAYARAQHEELTTSKKCSTVQIYKNSAVLAVSRLRKELQECKGVKKSASDCLTLQKMPGSTPGGKPAGSWSIESKNRKNADTSKEFVGAKLYNNIVKWVLTEEQLKQNGFPRPHESGQKGRAIIYGQNKQKPPKGFFRTCCRCKKDYMVDKHGFPASKEECIYHPNNKYRVRGEARYQCCSQDGTSDGCCIAPSHVYEYVDFENLKGFVKTLPPETAMDDYGIYALDCEMCYTTHGLDLTRVTVINSECKVIYETLIRPLHPIIDYNTRYSGITEDQMVGVTTTLLDVQATLLTMFNSKTILIGHSLESDFKVLKLIHDTVIDTSVLYPHKMGPPYKRALRNLSSEYLKKIIQNSVDGHDSAEDATVCMELIHYKLKEDLKTR